MEFKIVVSDPKTGKSYQVEAKDDHAKKLRGKKIGDTIEGVLVDLPGYTLKVTGGSDKGGFPMKSGVHSANAQRILMGDGVGFKADKGERARRRIHGEIVGDAIVQINTSIAEYGSKSLEEIFAPAVEEASEKPKED